MPNSDFGAQAVKQARDAMGSGTAVTSGADVDDAEGEGAARDANNGADGEQRTGASA